MSRWTTYDSDSYRLPSGMERIGYDSDSRRYTFRDQRGAVWVGMPGEEFGGEMEQISGPTRRESSEGNDKDEDEPIWLTGKPGVAPPPAEANSDASMIANLNIRDPSTMTKFSDFLPTSKLTTAAKSDSKETDKSSSAIATTSGSSTSNPGPSMEKTITQSAKSSKFRWNLLRSKSTTQTETKMRSVVNATVKHSKSDSSKPKRSKGEYQLLDSEERERRGGSEGEEEEEEE